MTMYFDLPPVDPSIEIHLATRGYSKGLAQTEGPQLLVRGELVSGPLFLGAYWKNVSAPVIDGEAGILVGARTSVSGLDLQASGAFKHYTGMDGPIDDEAVEFAVAASRRIGSLTPRVSVTYSPDELGSTGKSFYFEAGASLEVTRWGTLSAHAGRRERRGGSDYTSFNFGFGQQLTPNLSTEIRYYDTAESAFGDIYRGRVVAAARLRF
jgi:hypothetical protein